MKHHGHLSDAQYQSKLRSIEKNRERQLEADIRQLMTSEFGRRLAYWIVFEVGALHASDFPSKIKDGGAQGMFLARDLGRREMAHDILEKFKSLASADYLSMMSEQLHARQADLALKEAAENESAREDLS